MLTEKLVQEKKDAGKRDIIGGWTTYTCNIEKPAQKAFYEALDGFVGVDYKPIAVAQQLVAGMNYRFFCNSRIVTPYATNACAIVNIFKPLNEKAIITSIRPIEM